MAITYKDNLHVLAEQIYKLNKGSNTPFRTRGLAKNEAQRVIAGQRKDKLAAQQVTA